MELGAKSCKVSKLSVNCLRLGSSAQLGHQGRVSTDSMGLIGLVSECTVRDDQKFGNLSAIMFGELARGGELAFIVGDGGF